MAADMQDFTNSWPHKVANFHIKAIGLFEDHFLTKYLPTIHYTMLVPALIFVCQELTGIFFRLTKNDYTLENIIIPIQYMLIIFGDVDLIYLLIYRRSRTAQCIQNARKKLHCTLQENTKWRNQLPSYKLFTVICVVTLYAIAVFTIVAPFLARFVFKAGSDYVMLPNWYPVDVLSDSLFWTPAYVYEAFVLSYTCYLHGVFYSVLLYTLMSTKVRFDALHQFLKDSQPAYPKHSTPNGERKTFNLDISREGPSTFDSSRRLVTDIAANRGVGIKRLKEGMQDLAFLQRQIKLINSAFFTYFTLHHFVIITTTSTLAFATAAMLRDADEITAATIGRAFSYLLMLVISLLHFFTVCHLADSIYSSQENSRKMWENDWFTEGKGFQKLFFYSKTALNQPLKITAYSFYPLNLRTFNDDLLRSWSQFLFLYNITDSK